MLFVFLRWSNKWGRRRTVGKEHTRTRGTGLWGFRMTNILDECIWHRMFVCFWRRFQFEQPFEQHGAVVLLFLFMTMCWLITLKHKIKLSKMLLEKTIHLHEFHSLLDIPLPHQVAISLWTQLCLPCPHCNYTQNTSLRLSVSQSAQLGNFGKSWPPFQPSKSEPHFLFTMVCW